MAVPLVKNESRRRHQVEHGGHDVAIEPGSWHLAELRKSPLVLWPQAVHHERKRPRSALRVLRRAGRIALGAVSAERWRPRQHQQVIIELSGLGLAAALSGRRP